MKNFFTLLFCVAAMGFAASANEAPNVNDCINTLLSGNQATTLRGVNLDFNNDGIVSIADVTAIIDDNPRSRSTALPPLATRPSTSEGLLLKAS